MKDEPTPQGQNSSYPEDDRLVKELEASNKKDGSLDDQEIGSHIEIDTEHCYKILRISPEASLSEIHEAFEKMNEAWHPDRYPHVFSWKEKSHKKLQEIRNAYEKLVRLYPLREIASQSAKQEPALLATTAEDQGSSDREKELPAVTSAPASLYVTSSTVDPSSFSTPAPTPASVISINYLRRIALIALPVITVFILVFLWPSPYHYTVINLGGKDYPLRINRVTSHTTYYNGNQWIVPPAQTATMREKAMPAPTAPSPPLSPPVQPLQSVQASPPAQTIEPAKPTQSSINGQITQPLRPLQQVKPTQPPSSDSSSAAKSVVPRKTSSLPQPQAETRTAKKNYAAPKAGEVKNNIAKPFSIQIIAYPEKDKADALAKQIRAGKIPARVEDVAIKGKGRWHRVLVGKFKNRTEALEYFSDHKIGKLYPQSFIQKSPNI